MKRGRVFLSMVLLIPFLGEEQDSITLGLSQEKHVEQFSGPRVNIDDPLIEISGIVEFGDHFLAMNDGGPDQHLYVLDTSGIIRRKIFVEARNQDWEALTIGDGNLFIGDIGNNFGQRDSLCVLKIPLEALSSDTIQREFIQKFWFSYAPKEHAINPKKHDLDCEAMIFLNGKIHMFSKNRKSRLVQHRVLDLDASGSFNESLESLSVKGQITDACVDLNGDLILLGYSPPTYSSFIVRYQRNEGDLFFQGKGERTRLGAYLRCGQSEAICVHSNGSIWIGAEGNARLKRSAQLYSHVK